MKLSVVIPVFNSLDTLKVTLNSLFFATDNLYEIILVDDCSEPETRDFINSLVSDKIRITKTRNTKHSWCTPNWRFGVKLATGNYIAICNSDITFSDHWDTYLLETLGTSTISCPFEEHPDGSITDLDPTIKRVDPLMLKGSCFMFRTIDREKLFDFSREIVHWYGDRAMADIANTMDGVSFNRLATIKHKTTNSGRLVDRKVYKERVMADLLVYEKWSGKDESLIRSIVEKMPEA